MPRVKLPQSSDEALAAFAAKRKAGVKRKAKPLREADIEGHGGDLVKAQGGIPYKFTSPARRSVPDRLNLLPIPEEHRALIARYVRFVEYKAPGESASESQEREHKRLRALGYYVVVIDTKAGADAEFANLFI